MAEKAGLQVSPATVRNDMAELAEWGYLIRPHSSAGGVPSDRGYRHYVETLEEPAGIEPELREALRQRFSRSEPDVELWVRVAAHLLAELAQNLAVVTLPRAKELRIQHIDLVPVREFLALLVLIFQEARLYQQLVPLEQATGPEELTRIANKLNSYYRGLSRREAAGRRSDLVPMEAHVLEQALRVMESEEERALQRSAVDGLRHLLSQPELMGNERARSLVEAMEEERLLKAIAPPAEGRAVTVVIGQEHQEEALYPFSLVLCPYGVHGYSSGAVAVVGPTRLDYAGTMAAVQHLATTMTYLLGGVYSPTA